MIFKENGKKNPEFTFQYFPHMEKYAKRKL